MSPCAGWAGQGQLSSAISPARRDSQSSILPPGRPKAPGGLEGASLSPALPLQGAAADDGRLKRGDQIVAVNGEALEGVTHEQAVAILKRQRGMVTLTVLS